MTRQAMKTMAATAVAVCATFMLFACSSDDDATPASVQPIEAAGNVPTEQREAFADGSISLPEYQTAFSAFEACANRQAGSVSDVRTDAATGLITYGVSGELSIPGASNGTPLDDCYQTHFSYIEAEWQTTNPALNDQVVQDNLDLFDRELRPCLEANGVEVPDEVVPGSQEFGDLTAKAIELITAGECTTSGG